jgi:hypothetical protein
MPNRIVRGELLRSERYHEVGETARLLYMELLLVADDYGLCHLAPVSLRMSCPTALTRTYEQMTKLLSELNDSDLIRVYEVEGARYGYIPRFRNWPQAKKPKYPLPTDQTSAKEINDLMLKRQCGHSVPKVSPPDDHTRSTRETVTVTVTDTEKEEKRENVASAPTPIGTRFEDKGLTENWADYCRANRPDLDPAAVYEDFRDYWVAKPGKEGRKSNWTSTWQMWVRKQHAVRQAPTGHIKGKWVG